MALFEFVRNVYADLKETNEQLKRIAEAMEIYNYERFQVKSEAIVKAQEVIEEKSRNVGRGIFSRSSDEDEDGSDVLYSDESEIAVLEEMERQGIKVPEE